jgi:hypothetical protein
MRRCGGHGAEILKPAKYAVAVRNGSDLFLFRTIKRKATSDVYVCWPVKKYLWFDNPHSSYHASGEVHIKTSPKSKRVLGRQQQRPDSSLKGVEGILLTPIDARELKKICLPSKYDGVFEIPIAEIVPSLHIGAYQVYFCLSEQGVSIPAPNLPGNPKLIRQHIFNGDLPLISVTLFKA